MPRRTDIQSILILGAGPIVIGQACEFDYSGAQACKALREEGYRVILVNSNPATIMTDPNMADATYIEPIQWEMVAAIIEKERPQALLPTMGGQTALNCALDLAKHGVLEKFQVEMIGANREAIDKAEDRERFRETMLKIGLKVPHSAVAHSLEEALQVQSQLGYPTIIRPSFTLGGSGGGIAYNREEFVEICERGLELSPTRELLIEESALGWKEYEMEVIRDKKDNCIIVCAIENFDPMGVHTGDSITVAPAQTLTDKEYQVMRDASLRILREIGVETGGSNVQFAIHPQDGRMIVIEMNPRVSRSSALASKATGFPIARVAAKLAVGYTLDELKNEITGGVIPASFEPTLDYVVTKIPRFNFEKFPQAEPRLSTQMKSVGEVMAMGRTFQESLQKALRSLETGVDGLTPMNHSSEEDYKSKLRTELMSPGPHRLWYIGDAFRAGFSLEKVHRLTSIDPWFLEQVAQLISMEEEVKKETLQTLTPSALYQLKRRGFSDHRLATLLKTTEDAVRTYRLQQGIQPVYKRVDSCAGEFLAKTAYLYSTYETHCESAPSQREKIMILGGGPNRIGQGIEFDYCCVHAAMAVREAGYEAIMVNCNPETVSTDYDISDRLYFEPLTLEDVLAIVNIEKPKGVIVQYGGQTPLKLARELQKAGVPIIGTSPDAIDRAEDRERFQQLIHDLGLKQPANGTVRSIEEGLKKATVIGYPLVVRPSYVLGGRAMEVVYHEDELSHYLHHAVEVSEEAPILLDRFVSDAMEIDIDAVCDGKDVFICGILQHIEQAGVHSGDSSCSLPPYDLPPALQEELRAQMKKMALALGVVGLINAQFAIQGNEIYVLEVNPRASRTVPFVSKAIGIPIAKIAVNCMLGHSLASQGHLKEIIPSFYSVKLPVFPFAKFRGVDPILGPEMKSTGEVMGIGSTFAAAYAKAQWGANLPEPRLGAAAFVSVRDVDKKGALEIARRLVSLGFHIVATGGTARYLQEAGIPAERINKVKEGRPHIVDRIKNDDIGFIVNTTNSKPSVTDSYAIRRSALQKEISYSTTIAGALAILQAMQNGRAFKDVLPLQALYS